MLRMNTAASDEADLEMQIQACMYACKCVCCPYHHPVSCDFFGQEKMERVRRLQAQLLSEPTRRVDETPQGPFAPGWVLRMQCTFSTCMSKVNVHSYMSWNMLTVRSQVRDSMLLKMNKVNMHLVPRRHKQRLYECVCSFHRMLPCRWTWVMLALQGPLPQIFYISCIMHYHFVWLLMSTLFQKYVCNNLLFCSSNRWGCHSDRAITRWCTKGGRAFIHCAMQYILYIYVLLLSLVRNLVHAFLITLCHQDSCGI